MKGAELEGVALAKEKGISARVIAKSVPDMSKLPPGRVEEKMLKT